MIQPILYLVFAAHLSLQATVPFLKVDPIKAVPVDVPANRSRQVLKDPMLREPTETNRQCPSLPTSFLTLTLTDSTGKDISDNVTVLHHHRSHSPATQKRALSRILNQCPPGYLFRYSHCDRVISPRAYAGYCSRSPHTEHAFFRGDCYATEFCVDTGRQFTFDDTAFCISTHDFTLFAGTAVKGKVGVGAGIGQLGIPPTEASGSQKVYAVEALLTGMDGQKSVFAESVSVQAMRYGVVHGRPLWVPVNGEDGTGQCSKCASVGVGKVPDGTGRFDVSMVLGAGTIATEVVLWLTSFKP